MVGRVGNEPFFVPFFLCCCLFPPHPTHPLLLSLCRSSFFLLLIAGPPPPPPPHRGGCCWPAWALSWALCSWKRSLRRFETAMDFCTQRAMQPLSRDDSALELKSSMHDVKQWSTRLPNSCGWVCRVSVSYT